MVKRFTKVISDARKVAKFYIEADREIHNALVAWMHSEISAWDYIRITDNLEFRKTRVSYNVKFGLTL